jgi:carbonic anhydrase
MAAKRRNPARRAALVAELRLNPEEALAKLIRGNERFLHGKRKPALGWHPDIGARPPFAVLLGCSDSRVPLEHVFDQEPGNLFVVRVAGNVVAPSQIGSVEFAAGAFDCSLALVLGHTECGAVNGTLRWIRGESVPESDSLRNIAERIRPHVSPLVRVAGRMSRKKLWREAVRANVLASVDRLWHGSRLLEDRVRDKSLKIVGAVYDLSTGRVEIVE